MLAAKQLGMPATPVMTHVGVLSFMDFVVETALGVSKLYIQSFPWAFLFGTGQGSGASPAIWLTLSTIMLETLKALVLWGMFYQSPDRSLTVHPYLDAFVDDTQNGLNGLTDAHLSKPWPLDIMDSQLHTMAQAWECILSWWGSSIWALWCKTGILMTMMTSSNPKKL